MRTEIANFDTRRSTQITEVRIEIGALYTRLSIQIAGVGPPQGPSPAPPC